MATARGSRVAWRAPSSLPHRARALVARDVREHRLADVVRLLAALALLRLARRRTVRIRVLVDVVGGAGGVVRGGGRRPALRVRADRRGDDDEPLPGPILVALGEVARDVAEPERDVVAGGLGRRQEPERR